MARREVATDRRTEQPADGPRVRAKRKSQVMSKHLKMGALLIVWLAVVARSAAGAHEEAAAPAGPANQEAPPPAAQNESSQQPAAEGAPAGRPGRQSRIYRIRATGANGSFAGSVMRLNAAQAASASLSRGPEAGGEPADEPRQPAGAGEAAEPKFGSRHSAVGKLAKQKACSGSAEVETAAEASSISASSQTLRLTGRPAAGPQPQLVAGHRAGGGEVDESLLAPNESPAPVEPAAAQPERSPPPPNEARSASVESILSLIDEFDSRITTNKTEAALSCDSGEMVIRLNFTEPFRGVVYPDNNRLSPCRFFGDGHHNYELRLPLRGCGTRQVAPRVFVNDVIVRFHKTLELEEDEVKTLICRYPPPLDANQAATGNALVHELGGPADANRHQPFELIDPTGAARPAGRLGAAGQTEVLGELQAPTNGRQRVQLADSPSPADRILSRQHQHNEQLLAGAPSAGVKQLNSRLFQPEPARNLETGQSRNSSSSAGYFDRLTSIELLFLISSLMFLVLLAFGFVGGYYCFSRRNRREPAGGAQLLGRRKRRSYYNSPTSLLTPAAAGVGVIGRPHHTHRGPPGGVPAHLVGGAPYQPAGASHRLLEQDPYGGPGRHPAPFYQQYLQTQAPSSPDDSDISNQNLLPTADLAGPKFGYLTSLSAAAAPSAHYQSSTVRPHQFGHHQLASAAGGRRQGPDSLQQVGGRRTAHQAERSFASSTLRSSADLFSRQHQQTPAAANTLGRRANRPAATTNEPLLNLDASSQHYQRNRLPGKQQRALPLASQTVAANLYYAQMRHAKSLQQLRGEQPDEQQDKDQPDYLNDDKIRQKQRQHFYDVSTLTRPGTPGRKARGQLGQSGSSSASDSELDTIDEHGQRPRLYLKSIEDSFVTNLTEIYGQEYKKRDSTRPLSLAEWRSRQPDRHTGAAPEARQTNDDDQTGDHSFQANLRSLTELDVNFAKSMLRPSQSGQPTRDEPTKSDTARRQAEAGPVLKAGPSAPAGSEANKLASRGSIDDLVISPDYNHGKLRLRTGRERKDGASSLSGSHESISYV